MLDAHDTGLCHISGSEKIKQHLVLFQAVIFQVISSDTKHIFSCTNWVVSPVPTEELDYVIPCPVTTTRQYSLVQKIFICPSV